MASQVAWSAGAARRSPTTAQIRVGVDGRHPGTLALRWAVHEAGLRGAPVVAVTALPLVTDDPGWAEAVARAVPPGTGVTRWSTDAPPAIALVDGLQPEDLLVLGRTSTAPMAHHRLGELTEAVLAAAPCPVVLVGHPGTLHGPHGRERIVVAIGGVDDLAPLRWAVDEAVLRHAELEVIHGWEPAPAMLPLTTSTPWPDYGPLVYASAADGIIQRALARCASTDLALPPVRLGSSADVAAVVLEAAESASLLVVGAGTGVGRHDAVRVLAPCPVVVVP